MAKTKTKMIQIRHVPEALHRKLKAKAAANGMTLSDFLLRQARRAADEMTMEEWFAELHKHEPVHLAPGMIAGIIREGRERR